MSSREVDAEDGAEKRVALAQWVCDHLPRRLMLLDLKRRQILAADRAALDAATNRPVPLPCPLEQLLTAAAISAATADQDADCTSSPLLSSGSDESKAADWKYARVIPGELGAFYQSGVADPAESPADAKNAPRDPLTGLSTRDALTPILEKSFRRLRSSGTGFALMFLDADHFKRINDEHGHLAGDEVLRRAAEGILHAIRPGDAAIRYGGDEMVLIIGGLHSRDEAAAVGRRISAAMGRAVDFGGKRVPFTVSIGIAYGRPDDPSPQAILDRADKAMYRAKNRGRSGEIEVD